MKKAKQAKLKFKPTPISRLLKYRTTPPHMVDDPPWRNGDWSDRSHKIYSEMMRIKRGGWSDRIWEKAWYDNKALDILIEQKWDDHDRAWVENIEMDFDAMWAQAHRDNAAWDYHHDNYIAA